MGISAPDTMPPVTRLICQFLIVWLALLSAGAHAHETTDAIREMSHIAVQTEAAGTEKAGMGQDHGPAESCSQGHCGHGHASGLLPTVGLHPSDASTGARLPMAQARSGREPPATIERPKWFFTTPPVVNL